MHRWGATGAPFYRYMQPDELAHETREDGELTYGFRVILNYLFHVDK